MIKIAMGEHQSETSRHIYTVWYTVNVLNEIIPDGDISNLKSSENIKKREEKYKTKILLKDKNI